MSKQQVQAPVGTIITPSDRYELFKECYEQVTELKDDDTIFKLTKLNLPPSFVRKYGKYVEELGEMEKYHLRENILKDFNDVEKAIILEIFPSSYFFDKSEVSDLDSRIKNAIERLQVLKHTTESFEGKIRRIIAQVSTSTVANSTVINLNSPENTFVVNQDDLGEFHPTSLIFIRKCYKDIFNAATKAAQTRCVAVIGDPGIGKSTLLRTVFSQLVYFSTKNYITTTSIGNNEFVNPNFKKVFWALASGAWRYFDGCKVSTGSTQNEVWKEDDVLLLLDGSFKDHFLSKVKKCIFFCSPDRNNYYKLIKMNHGKSIIMPPWTLDELVLFFESKPAESSILNGMSLFADMRANLLDAVKVVDSLKETPDPMQENVDLVDPESEKSHLLVNDSLESFANIAFDTYDEVRILKELASLTKNKKLEDSEPIYINFFKDYMRRRFDIVGGKFRLVFDIDYLLSDLKEIVRGYIRAVSMETLHNVDSMDYYDNAPSMIYSMIPLPGPVGSERPRYYIDFASKYILERVRNKILTGDRSNFDTFFSALKNHRIEGYLVGKVFENAVHDFFLKNSQVSLKIRDVSPTPSSAIITTDFKKEFKSMKYDCFDDDLEAKVTAQITLNFSGNLFLYPAQMNAPSIDSILRSSDGQYYFFQITVSESHPVKRKDIVNLCRSLNILPKDVYLVFIVTENNFKYFQTQPIYVESSTRSATAVVKGQKVAYVENLDEMARFFSTGFPSKEDNTVATTASTTANQSQSQKQIVQEQRNISISESDQTKKRKL